MLLCGHYDFQNIYKIFASFPGVIGVQSNSPGIPSPPLTMSPDIHMFNQMPTVHMPPHADGNTTFMVPNIQEQYLRSAPTSPSGS